MDTDTEMKTDGYGEKDEDGDQSLKQVILPR